MSKINDLIEKLCPNGVEYKSLKDVFELFSGMTGVSNKWADEGNCRFIDYMNAYKNNKIDITKIPYATVKNMKQTTLIQGDLLLTSASEVPDECAIASVIEAEIQDGVFMDDHLFGLRLKDEYKGIINTTFISYYLNSKPFRCNLFKAVRGVTRFYISNKDYIKLTIPIPPLEVQEEIVRILDKFGELEAELEAELETRKSQYEFWREKIINIDNNVIELGDVCKIVGRIGFRGYTRNDLVESKEDGAISLSPGNIKNNNLNYDNPTYVSWKKYEESPEIMIDNNDIIFCKTGSTVGKVALVQNLPHKATINPQLVVLKELKCNPSYLAYIMGSNYFQSEVMRIKGLGSVPTISQKDLAKLKISLPSRAEQDKIAIILDKFNTLINDITVGIPAEIELRRKQYEYYRDKLLSFEELSVSE